MNSESKKMKNRVQDCVNDFVYNCVNDCPYLSGKILCKYRIATLKKREETEKKKSFDVNMGAQIFFFEIKI